MKGLNWIFFLVLVFIFLKTDAPIINTPNWIDLLLFFLVFLLIVIYRFYKKVKVDKDAVDYLMSFLRMIILSFIFFLPIKSGINIYGIYYARTQPIIERYYRINKYYPSQKYREARVSYIFIDGNEYRLPIKNEEKGISRQEILENYRIRLLHSESVLNLYIILDYKIIKDD